MKRFLITDYSNVSAMDQMANATPEQAKAGMDLWMRWAGDRVSVGGYSILEAESCDALAGIEWKDPGFGERDLGRHQRAKIPRGVVAAGNPVRLTAPECDADEDEKQKRPASG